MSRASEAPGDEAAETSAAAPVEPPATRRFRRRTVRISVRYAVQDVERCDVATTLGAGGLFVQTARPLPRGTRLVVRFCLPGSDRVHELPGRVVFAHEPAGEGSSAGMGIEFTDAHGIAQLAHAIEALERAS
jgi:uncharacterized protein (TIGR02266 family)